MRLFSRPILIRQRTGERANEFRVPANRPTRATWAASRARSAVFWFLALFGGTHLGLILGMESIFLQIRDPEYGRKLNHLRERVAVCDGRPLVLVIGSSRSAMGIRPDVIEQEPWPDPSRPRPVVFNASLVGSGPVMELMCLRRMIHHGVRPDAVVLEIWPPFLYEESGYHEEFRIDPNRLYDDDVPLIHRYTTDPDKLSESIAWARWAPWFSHRFFLLSQAIPTWLTWDSRRDFAWAELNDWGWLAGLPDSSDPAERQVRIAKSYGYYAPILGDWAVSPVAHEATCELLHLCRVEEIPVTLLVLPESTELRSWYPPHVTERVTAYLDFLRSRFELPMFDCREWIDDVRLLDGFHLTRGGADEFSKRFAGEILPHVPLREARP